MDAASVLFVVAAAGVNFGWQPDEKDPQAYEVVVQLEPQLVEALGDGHTVPIDAHIPPGVEPIRKVRVMVGTGDVPRRPLASARRSESRTAAYPNDESAAAAAKESAQSLSSPTIVRGQDAGWSNDRYSTAGASNSKRYDQIGPSIGVGQNSASQAPPPLQRFENAVVETGNTLRSGVEAGIQAANEDLSRTGEKLSEMVTDDDRKSSPVWAPPPLWENSSSASAASTPTASVARPWSSIRPDRAPPRLQVPALRSDSVRVAVAGSTSTNSGPSFPAPSNNSAPLHSVLVDQSSRNNSQPSPKQQNWSDSWGNPPASRTASSKTSASQLSSTAQPRSTSAAEEARRSWPERNSGATSQVDSSTHPSNNPPLSPPAVATADRYSQPTTTPRAETDPWAVWDQQTAATKQQAAGHQGNTAANNSPATSHPEIKYDTQSAANTQTAPPDSERPWLLFTATAVGLAGSLAANLFLGMSYADARHKYRALVRKTTHAFQKRAGVAA